MFSKELFGRRLRELRMKHQETQTDLALFLGVKKSQISVLEHGIVSTTPEKIVLLCTHYRVSADYLLGLTDDPEPPWGKEPPPPSSQT